MAEEEAGDQIAERDLPEHSGDDERKVSFAGPQQGALGDDMRSAEPQGRRTHPVGRGCPGTPAMGGVDPPLLEPVDLCSLSDHPVLMFRYALSVLLSPSYLLVAVLPQQVLMRLAPHNTRASSFRCRSTPVARVLEGSAMKDALLLLMASTWLLAGVGAADASGSVTAQGTQLMLDSKEYRAIGVNVPHLHQIYMGTWFHLAQIYGTPEKARQAAVDAILDAERSRVAFIRFFATPGYPRDIAKLYWKDPERYWRLMDELFALCRQHHVRLVPSLGVITEWHLACGEPTQAILDPKSKTYQATYRYVREFVTRYKDDPNVLMWELQNEAFLLADLNMTGHQFPGLGIYPEGAAAIREKGTLEDSLTFAMLQKAYREITAFVKGIDPNHLVTSGDADVRDCSESLRESFPDPIWTLDSLRQHLSNLLASQPEPLDVFSIHAYGPGHNAALPGNLSGLDYSRCLIRALHSALCPVFVGELGNAHPSFREDPEAKWTRSAIDMLEQEGVALAAIWVWHFPWQPELTVSGETHPLLARRIAQFNREYAGLQ
jgi:mannan endo-1,4-beta-mannosidase